MSEEQIKTPEEDLAEIMEGWAKDEKDPAKWEINRLRNYPQLRDQLAKIGDDGIEKWKEDMIDPIKKKFPKPK